MFEEATTRASALGGGARLHSDAGSVDEALQVVGVDANCAAPGANPKVWNIASIAKAVDRGLRNAQLVGDLINLKQPLSFRWAASSFVRRCQALFLGFVL